MHDFLGGWRDRTAARAVWIAAPGPTMVHGAAAAAGTPVTLASLGPLNVWVGLTNSDDVGNRFDFKAEIYRNTTTLLGSGELASVQGGSSRFNNADPQSGPGVLF
jgi:hypothetical protein